MKWKPGLLFILLLCLGTAFLSGCQTTPPAVPTPPATQWAEIILTPEEQAWIAANPNIQVHIENWPPFMVYENGQSSGIAVETVELLLVQVGVQPVYVETQWSDALQNFVQLRGADILPVVARTPQREEIMYLTSDYISFPLVIFTQNTAPFVGSITDLNNRVVAVEKSYVTQGILTEQYPQIKLLETNTSLEALQALSNGKVDAYIGNLAVASYLIQQNGLANLKVAAPSSLEDHRMAIGSRKDHPELASILQKALDAMPEDAASQIRQNWLAVRYEYGISEQDVLMRILTTVLVSVLVLGLVIYWNWRLTTEIEHRKQAQSALQEGEDLLRTVIDTSPDMILVKDQEGNFILVNRAGAAIYDLTPEQMQGRNERDLIELANADPDEVNMYLRKDRRVINENAAIISPTEPTTRRGKGTRWFHTSRIPLKTPGKPTNVLVVSTDVTERKLALEALQQERSSLAQRVEERTAELMKLNLELQEAAHAKDEFLATMSHELRTPLNAILGMSEILLENLYGELNPKQTQYLKVIEESGQHLLALVSDILDLAKIEAGERMLDYQTISISEICEASLAFINPLALKKSIKVSFQDSLHTSMMEADPRALKQILINMLTNAVKFTTETGRIGLEVRGNPQNNTVQFTVWDNGIGITPEQSQRLFKPFVQVDSSLSRNYEGTGLGLSLILRLTDMHGGSVTLESSGVSGEGSRFSILLPVHPAPDTSSRIEIPEIPHAHILLMDDEVNSLKRMQAMLVNLQCRVMTAESNLNTLRLASENPPHLILLDLQIPLESSLNIIQELRKQHQTTRIPIVVMTALSMPGSLELCRQSGADECLLKPVSPSELAETLEKYLQN
jgi:two-component system sensor histidine kinase/response regulator